MRPGISHPSPRRSSKDVGFLGGGKGCPQVWGKGPLETFGRVLLRRAGVHDSSLYCTTQTQTPASPMDATFYFQIITRTHLLLSAATAITLVQATIILLPPSIQSQILSLLCSKPNPSLKFSPWPTGPHPVRPIDLSDFLHRSQGLCTSSSLHLESVPTSRICSDVSCPTLFLLPSLLSASS